MRSAANHSSGRRLIFRLTSLGDVILATSALGADPGADGPVTDWVVAKEYAGLLAGHPRIGRVWAFDRKAGLGEWLRLCRELACEGYDEVLDLHSSLRTRVARAVFLVSGGASRARWRRLSKARWRFWGYCLGKGAWPRALRPAPMVERFARFGGGTGQERPDLRYLLKAPTASAAAESKGARGAMESGSPYVCVMPAARWPGKCWPAEHYAETLAAVGLPVVILGAEDDAASAQLARLLVARSVPVPVRGPLGRQGYAELARVIAGAAAYVGNDTGLGHLAEALGVPALMIFGPTTPELGFGPWGPRSRAIGASLWCRPCGKDGRACFRYGKNRYACLSALPPAEVAAVARALCAESGAGASAEGAR